jgi:peptidyl-prolyl cis-trans isomerase B (cyclophilin B)
MLADADVPVARSFYFRFGPPPNRRLLLRIVDELGDPPWEVPPAQPARGLDFYESVVRELIVPAAAGKDEPRAELHTGGGVITLALAAGEAPLTVYNFQRLIDEGFYPTSQNDPPSTWHRIVPNFVVQDGDPTGTGSGGPGWAIRDEASRLRYGRSVLGMARAGIDTGGSQFFITLSPAPHLDAAYTVFGRAVTGMDIADRLLPGDPVAAFVRVRPDGS